MELDAWTRAYLDEIAGRLRLANGKPVKIFCDAPLRDFIAKGLPGGLTADVSFGAPEDAPTFDPVEDTMVIATHSDRWQANRLHGMLSRPKRRGMIVALAMLDRRLSGAPPGWDNTGLSYDGMFCIAAEYARSIRGGDYAEFGTFDGYTFVKAFHALSPSCKRFFAFDSFAGILGSQPEENGTFVDGQYSCNIATFEQNLDLAKVDRQRTVIVQGSFQESLQGGPAAHGLQVVSVAHIDTDVYEPARLALGYLAPVLRQGALILFDDFDQMAADDHKGERRALREWLAANPGFRVEPYRNYAVFGRSFIFHRT